MTMRLKSSCIRCLLDKQPDRIPAEASEEQKVECLQRILKRIGEARGEESAPVIVRDVERILKEMFGSSSDFTEIKRYYNEMMLEKAPGLRRKIQEAEAPFRLALKYAMTGNYIDFGARHQVEDHKLEELLEAAPQVKLPETVCRELEADLETAKSVVYLTDNCGEIVLDRLLMEQIRAGYPDAELTVLVRGEAVVNDADMEDARQTGLMELGRVLGNGNDIGGTWMEELSEEALCALKKADVILSKGQGNFDTLQGCGLNVYYLFMCKCEMFTERFGVKLFDGVLVRDRALCGEP